MKKKALNPTHDFVNMPMVHTHAAAIDVGDTLHSVAIPKGIFSERVKTFGSMTCDLETIAAWLSSASITSLALESTGVRHVLILGKGELGLADEGSRTKDYL